MTFTYSALKHGWLSLVCHPLVMTNEIGPTLHPLLPTTTPATPVMLLSKLISLPSGGASQKHSNIDQCLCHRRYVSITKRDSGHKLHRVGH